VLFQTLMAGFSESGWGHVASKLFVSLCCCWAGTFGSQALSFTNHLVPDCLLCSVLTGLLFTWVDITQQLQDYIYIYIHRALQKHPVCGMFLVLTSFDF
jgi:hypothetical protein